MIGLYDIHCHILPVLDDGSGGAETSLRMLEAAYRDGTRGVILTPHYKFDDRIYKIDRIRDVWDEFRELCAERLPQMELYLGCEAYGETDLPRKLDDGKVLTMVDTRYVLVEYRPSIEYSHVERSLDELLRYGYKPILAHVERYQCFRKSPDKLDELVYMGALVQVNANSVIGRRGFSTKRFIGKLLDRHIVNFIASDAHDEVHRPALLGACAKFVENRYGSDYMSELFAENPLRIINNEPI